MFARLVGAAKRDTLRAMRMFFLAMFLLSALPTLVRIALADLPVRNVATGAAMVLLVIALRTVEVARGRTQRYPIELLEATALFGLFLSIHDLTMLMPVVFPAVIARSATVTFWRFVIYLTGVLAAWQAAWLLVPAAQVDRGAVLSMAMMGMVIYGMQFLTQRQQAMHRRQSELLGTVLNRLPFPVVVTDDAGAVVLANPAATALVGSATLHDAVRLAGSGEVTLVRPDGTAATVRVEPVPLDEGTVYALLDVTAQREHESILQHAAFHDPLTGLPNRALLWQRLGELGDAAYTVLLLDLDGFKQVNDNLGHAAGDELLIGVAHRVRDVSGPHATVARLGGDEFAVLTVDDPERLAAAIRGCFAVPFPTGSGPVQGAGSVGWATRGPGQRPDEVIAAADRAMYRHKPRATLRSAR